MHQYKTIAQILLILSISNHVLAAPVVREHWHDVHGDVAVPVVGNVALAVKSKERRLPALDGEPAPSDSSPGPTSGKRRKYLRLFEMALLIFMYLEVNLRLL
jgi:hypothetical protein